MLAHNVYFKLEDDSVEAIDRLVRACHQYLKDHPGVEFFAAGTLVEELDRTVNDRDFHVALHVVFTDKAAHDAYQSAEDHLRFIDQQKDNWQQVRVFDSYVDS
jgi:quinol monooxygenase YgiN